MAENEKSAKPAAEAEKTAVATKQPEPERASPKKTKIVAETGRYICKHPIIFMSPDGKRTTARAGEVVAIHESDAKVLRKRHAIENEEESAEA